MAKQLTPEQQATYDALTMDPQNFTITLSGYGGEIVVGTAPTGVLDYLRSNKISVSDMVFDTENELDIPEEIRFIEDSNWYDCDHHAHCSGLEMGSSGWLTVTAENGESVFSCDTEFSTLADSGITTECNEDIDVDDITNTTVFVGQAIEKGVFFEATVNAFKFDPKLLEIEYSIIDGWILVSGARYDGEQLEGWDGYSTTGKSSYYRLVNTATGLVYEDPQDDTYWPNAQEYTEYHPGTVDPCYVGWYDCDFYSDWSSSTGRYYWDGKGWFYEEYKKLKPVSGNLRQWRGLNWDTSDWNNAPRVTAGTVSSDKPVWPF